MSPRATLAALSLAAGLTGCVHAPPTPGPATETASPAASRFSTVGVHGGRVEYRMTVHSAGDSTPRPLGTIVVERTLVQHIGRPAVLSVSTFASPRGDILDSSLTMLGTLLPVWERSHQPTKQMSLDFAGARVTGSVTPTGATVATAVDQTLAEPVYNSTDIDLLVASLPLAAGFATTLPTYTYEAGGLVMDSLRVVGPATITIGTVPRDVWEVAFADAYVTMTAWVDRRTREIVRRETVPRKSAVRIRTDQVGA